ncbi:MAG: hypothetical protein PHO08_06350 [Methylococcales bacterium]|nr:hypothetical protein [Methylococcales bacterium]
MFKHNTDTREIREILLALLSNSGTLAGISLALVGILNLKPLTSKIGTYADDLFLFSALGFVIICYLVFFALQILNPSRISYWAKVIDILFLSCLTMQVVAGFLTVYTIV